MVRVIFIVLIFISPDVFSQDLLKVKRTPNFVITGKGTEPLWNATQWVTLQNRRNTGEIYDTRFKILYSDSGIYCLFFCEDKKITATMKADFMNLWLEDVVEVFFWTDTSRVLYFEYELSPLNFELPILVPNNNGKFFGWLPWHYKGNRRVKHATQIYMKGTDSTTITGWSAEFFIPFELLKPLNNVPAKKGTHWRANFYRLDHDKGNSAWSWQPVRKTFHDYESFGVLVFD